MPAGLRGGYNPAMDLRSGPHILRSWLWNPELRRRSVGSAVMERVRQEIQSYELSGLWPDHPEFYARLGWDMWRGPLAIRTDDEVQDTPDDKVMVLRTPFTPEIDFDARLTAEWRPREVW